MGITYKILHRKPTERRPKVFDKAMPLFQYTRTNELGQKEAHLIMWVLNRGSENKKLKWSRSSSHTGPHDRRKRYSIKAFTQIRRLRQTTDDFRSGHFVRMTTNLLERIINEVPAANINGGGFSSAELNLRPACLGYVPRRAPSRQVDGQSVRTNVRSFNHRRLPLHEEWRTQIEGSDAWKKATIEASRPQPSLFDPATKKIRPRNKLLLALSEWCRYVFSDLMEISADQADSQQRGYWRTAHVKLTEARGVELTERDGDFPAGQ
jgi:hypothetical protein